MKYIVQKIKKLWIIILTIILISIFLFTYTSNYEPSETIGDIFRKLIWGTSNQNIDYPPVTTETYGLFSSRSILKPSVKEEYKNYLDKNTDNLITKRGTINAKQYCNNSQDCMGYYSEKTDPEQYYFLKGALIKDKANCLFVTCGYYFINFKPSVIIPQNFLPFDDRTIKDYKFSLEIFRIYLLRLFLINSIKKADGIIFLNSFSKKI